MIPDWKENINYPALFFLATTVLLGVLLMTNPHKSGKRPHYDSSSILDRIVYIQDLALVKYNYTGVIGYKDNMKFLNIDVPLTEKYFLLKYSGYIKAGVDFSRVKVEAIGKKVHVSIPKSKITDTAIDENSVEVYNESENAFNPIKIDDYNKAIIREKDAMTREAEKRGILTEATQQAKLALTSLLKEMGFEDIDITEELTIPQYH
ncbi:MAG: DUF4230 domain-containing protein [Dysgonamonadaceae bacterium]|jgi:hypothetical protein|nr:DUF4230 domain-containing protein [Dysgonamonadaceae bacterium]